MAHEVETMFTVGEPPWHGLGNRFTSPPKSMEEAISAAGLGWRVDKRRLFLDDGRQAPAHATVRDSDGSILGVVRDRYEVLQNEAAFKLFEPLVTSEQITLEAGGSLRGGARVWLLGQLNRSSADIVPGDEIQKYLLLSHGHDGTLSIHFGLTPVRVVCANTEALAREKGSGSSLLKIRHTASAVKTLEQARDLVNVADAAFEATFEQYRRLARKVINQAEMKTFFRLVTNTDLDATLDDLSTKRKNRLDELMGLVETAPGAEFGRGTLWSVYNAWTYFLNHRASRSQGARVDSLWYGAGANDNSNGLQIALRMAA